MFEKKRIFITVKTYPTISEKYAELVCTAGVLEDGTWIRIYPMPFRLLKDDQKYPKYTWVNTEVERNTSDFRPESYRPNLSTMAVEYRPKNADWDQRRKIIFNNNIIYTNLKTLIDKARSDGTSLAVFKPTKIIDFIVEPDKREWNTKKLASLQAQSKQFNLFKTIEEIEEEFKVVQKVPYKFKYRFEDDSGKESRLMIEDWEIGMLYLNCLKSSNGDEKVAITKVREKYLDFFLKRDIYFFLGTTKRFHYVGQNPFIIVGVFYPPMPSSNQQMTLFNLED